MSSGPTSPDVGNITGSRKRCRAARGSTSSARRRPRRTRDHVAYPQMLVTASPTTDQHKSAAGGGATKQQARRKRYQPFAFEDLNVQGIRIQSFRSTRCISSFTRMLVAFARTTSKAR